jgi:hypothetical protein
VLELLVVLLLLVPPSKELELFSCCPLDDESSPLSLDVELTSPLPSEELELLFHVCAEDELRLSEEGFRLSGGGGRAMSEEHEKGSEIQSNAANEIRRLCFIKAPIVIFFNNIQNHIKIA